ncbi:hypothetical protein B0H10DRAFT_1958699 [Mycena sp. CBHHK59/15]|nr:hypothetical protein B0H10DRAFT_1958699 [Mycena sp. CBHHK59/15]
MTCAGSRKPKSSRVIEVVAAIAVDLQRSLDNDLSFAIDRMLDTFHTCFKYNGKNRTIREGMMDCAIHCGQAYGIPKELSPEIKEECYWHWHRFLSSIRVMDDPGRSQDGLFAKSFKDPYHLTSFNINNLQHNTHLCLDHSFFADYLLCLNSFFSPPTLHDLACKDKSAHMEVEPSNKPVLAKIVTHIAELPNQIPEGPWIVYHDRHGTAIYQFFSTFPRSDDWAEVILSALSLTTEIGQFGGPDLEVMDADPHGYLPL